MEMSYVLQLAQLIGYAVLATVFVVMLKADVRMAGLRMDGLTEQMKIRTDNLSAQLAILNASFNKLNEVLSQVAVQNTEIEAIKNDINDLRRGRGWITESLTGEYMHRGKIKD